MAPTIYHPVSAFPLHPIAQLGWPAPLFVKDILSSVDLSAVYGYLKFQAQSVEPYIMIGNHPIGWLKVSGRIMGVETKGGHHWVQMDDSSGGVLVCKVVKGSPKRPAPQRSGTGCVRNLSSPAVMLFGSLKEPINYDSLRGKIVECSGWIATFDRQKTLQVETLELLGDRWDLDVEVQRAKEKLEFRQRYLKEPWNGLPGIVNDTPRKNERRASQTSLRVKSGGDAQKDLGGGAQRDLNEASKAEAITVRSPIEVIEVDILDSEGGGPLSCSPSNQPPEVIDSESQGPNGTSPNTIPSVATCPVGGLPPSLRPKRHQPSFSGLALVVIQWIVARNAPKFALRELYHDQRVFRIFKAFCRTPPPLKVPLAGSVWETVGRVGEVNLAGGLQGSAGPAPTHSEIFHAVRHSLQAAGLLKCTASYNCHPVGLIALVRTLKTALLELSRGISQRVVIDCSGPLGCEALAKAPCRVPLPSSCTPVPFPLSQRSLNPLLAVAPDLPFIVIGWLLRDLALEHPHLHWNLWHSDPPRWVLHPPL